MARHGWLEVVGLALTLAPAGWYFSQIRDAHVRHSVTWAAAGASRAPQSHPCACHPPSAAPPK